MYERKWKGRFPAMIYGVILLLIFALNCVAVVGIDAAVRFPFASGDAAMEALGEYTVLDTSSGHSRWGMRVCLIETDKGMELTGVEKNAFLNRYRLLPRQPVVEGQRCPVWGSQGKITLTVTDGQLEGATLTVLEYRLIPNTEIYIPYGIFFGCIGLMVVELIAFLLLRKLRGN